MQVRNGVMLGLAWVLGFTSINAVGQDTFSGCGVLFLEPEKCLPFYAGRCNFPFGTVRMQLDNVEGFGHLDCVYVTGTLEEGCIGNCGGGRCLPDNTIEPCPVCGDGVVGPTEECDDQDLDDGDGCSSTCTTEDGFSCSGEPSVCNGIPATSTWGTLILTLLLLSAGTLCLRRRVRLLACFGALMFVGAAFAQSPKLEVPHHPERLLVRFKGGTSKTAQQSVHTALGSTELKAYHHVDGLVLVHVSAEDLATALDAYLVRPEVL